ncbi:concanavalin A-like lectin/glucanase [Gigaspora margarita]|uniref:Concanavalin A-like lectin/glucanase n=1 Tax=Gigaspora margarita TaxID=4874 RepID=A0A8H4B5W4_GIGMA|nr:concanavalin A-like lectin/glucanase [Gigaspora margarita]
MIKKLTQIHNELPSVTNELSVTLQLNLKRHDSNWINIFHKGEDAHYARTPALWLSPNDSRLHPNCSANNKWNYYISAVNSIELNIWYHITYTLSVPQKRMELYVNGKLVGSIETNDIKFNEFPLNIGHSGKYTDFQGQMSNELDRNRVKIRTKEIDPNGKFETLKSCISISISTKVYLMFSDYLEIFSEPTYFPTNKKTIQHNELPSVINELSVTFQLNLERHDPSWISIFIKGENEHARTPALWFSPNDSKLHPNCSVNNKLNYYISAGNSLELNKWYHIAYTLSEPQKRMELCVNGELIGYTDVKNIIFNEFPLKIGHSDKYPDFQGQMSNFRYYNIRLSADEIFKSYILYHSNELGFKGDF